ncbi:OLC1v1005768C1 [Oldenlandia corymbosa var. corymbosa]|uniref:OLC1v1005768C1 n=1 Tax=Oldenlandia corymbosa var. corymbosa TaxID=529605 RepID=A0AAV1DFQ0_OLDCO|nr:OLC1v1005768C1 [Oldenlandia corymbosa var. corymbosa]
MENSTVDCNGENGQNFSYAMQLATSVSLPMVLYNAVKLNLFEIIAKAGCGSKLSPTQIAAQLGSKNLGAASVLDRMLRVLSTYSVLTCDEVASTGNGGGYERVYGLTPVGEYSAQHEDGISV